MSDLKPTGIKIKLGDNEYGLRFTLNAIDDIQEHFDIPIGELSSLFTDSKKRIKNLKYILTLLINEDIDCLNDEGKSLKHLDERYVGRYIDASNMREFMVSTYKAFSDGAPKSDDDDPNAASE